MMLRILRDKFVRLGRDDDGMAMVVTLAVFMFMWLVCMGVYAIGTAVKTRIHLQNACDAAAYSAAVVQADTLSRIATINRAMSWTYIQMTRRQMDYIVDRWLVKTVGEVKEDVSCAIGTYGDGIHDEPDHKKYWDLRGSSPTYPRLGRDNDEDDTYVSLNGNSETSVKEIKDSISDFENNWYKNNLSFYNGAGSGIEVLGNQIDADKQTLEKMHNAEVELADELSNRVECVVKEVLVANMTSIFEDIVWKYNVSQSSCPYSNDGSGAPYLKILDSSEEIRFLAFSECYPSDEGLPFDVGSANSQWFPLSEGTGFLRKYKQRTSELVARWFWRTWKWFCDPDDSSDCVLKSNASVENKCKGMDAYDKRFDGVAAKPLVLMPAYFSKNGTITVGIAVENDNPWAPIFKLVPDDWRSGIFSAFSIGKDLTWTPQYTVCIASAKAGYKFLDEDVENTDRAYRISWENVDWREDGQSWNLCQSDWDAVLIPVRRAETFAKGKGGVDAIWDGDVGDFLDGYLTQLADSSEMLAGGLKNMDSPEWKDGNGRNLPPDYYRFDQWKGLPDSQSWDWTRDGVDVQWQIENKNARIDWGGIQKVMFH